MAELALYVPFLRKWEGGYSNHPADRGGVTQYGVTLRTWQQLGYDKNRDGGIDAADLRLIDSHDLEERVLRPHFWNRWQADRIRTQAIADLLVDWLWMSGPYTIRLAQKELKVEMDGVVGNRTLEAINTCTNQYDLFYRLKVARYAHLYRIVGYRPANRVFLEGWLNRVRDLKFRLSMIVVLLSVTLMACRPAQVMAHREESRIDTQRVQSARALTSEFFELETSFAWVPLVNWPVADSLPALLYACNIRQRAARTLLQRSDSSLTSSTVQLHTNAPATAQSKREVTAEAQRKRKQATAPAGAMHGGLRQRSFTGWFIALIVLAVAAVVYQWRRKM